MIRFVLRRLLSAIPTLLVVTILIFLMIHLLPGDPAQLMLGEAATPQTIHALRHELGLDRPLVVQYASWLGNAARLHFGVSTTNTPVATLIAQKLPITLELALLSVLISILIALPAGIVSSLRPGGGVDQAVTVLSLSGISLPTFFTGIVLIYVFSIRLGWVPASGYVGLFKSPLQNLRLMILPSFTLGFFSAAILTRYLKASMLEVMGQDYIRTAHAKGLRGRQVIVKHQLRNALIPVITILGLQLGALLGGAIITEQIFSIPGFGNLLVYSVLNRDLPVIQTIVLLAALGVFVANFMVDMAYALIDPRIRYG